MVKKWLTMINYSLMGLIGLLLLATLYFYFMQPSEFLLPDITAKKADVPKGTFTRSAQDYEAIGSRGFELTFAPLSVQLPDLKKYITYYGKNSRPDANQDKPVMYFSFQGNKTTEAASPGERLYVMYDKRQSPPQYIFSEGNVETPLWIEGSPQGSQALVKVAMKGDNEKIIREPAAYAEFMLPEKEFVRFSGVVWELGTWRVDGTLLARQKARWHGIDRFLEDHGGPEYQAVADKQRIDFGEGDETYSVYVGIGNCLIWEDNHWKAISENLDSFRYPLMCVKKIDDRIMNLELWDVGGKGKVSLNMVKTTEAWMPQNLEQSFKFIGARTRSQFIFEINKERMFLSPHDWLLLLDSTWKKLQTAEEIDDYVDRRAVGPLFVFDQIERKDDRQVIIGTLYNAARTEKVVVELPLQQASSGAQTLGAKPVEEKKKKKVQESNQSPMINSGRPPMVGPKGITVPPDDDDDED